MRGRLAALCLVDCCVLCWIVVVSVFSLSSVVFRPHLVVNQRLLGVFERAPRVDQEVRDSSSKDGGFAQRNRNVRLEPADQNARGHEKHPAAAVSPPVCVVFLFLSTHAHAGKLRNERPFQNCRTAHSREREHEQNPEYLRNTHARANTRAVSYAHAHLHTHHVPEARSSANDGGHEEGKDEESVGVIKLG